MRKKACLLFMGLLIGFESWSGANKYPVASIPDDLKKNANVVYREDQMTFTIPSRDRARQKTYVAITVLNEKGKSASVRGVAYSRLVKVTSISGAIYDAEGNLVRKLKNSEIQDESATGSNLFTDDRVKIANLSHISYPYTIEFEAELEYQYLFFIPSWHVIPSENTSVQHSLFTLEFAPEVQPRFKTYHTNVKETERSSNGLKSWTWEFSNMGAVEREPWGPALYESTPIIVAAPGEFTYEGYSGNMNDWNGFGLWIQSLAIGRDQLPEATREKILAMTSGTESTEEKIRALYKYLQDHTRYVSIQIGVGGQQPVNAAEVDQNGYGDCKGLANYMVAILKAAGIQARYVLIRAGSNENDIDPEFVSTQFNHAVAAVPLSNDTIWLECTSQTNPIGYAGTFTGDRHALMITEKGGRIVRTPTYASSSNRQMRTINASLAKDGNITASVTTNYEGLQFENDDLDAIVHQSPERQKKWVLENTSLPGFELKSYSMIQKSFLPQIEVAMSFASRSYASVSGKRIFLNPNLLNRTEYVPRKLEQRKTPIIRKNGYVDMDTVRFTVPEELYPEFIPPVVHYESRFGSYDATFTFSSGQLIYTRTMKWNRGRFPEESYEEFAEFYKSISKADNVRLVFLSKT
ncbi:MAG: DUF3857 domain-containing transglutaminase family protein [Bacteroidetes bacterium]|nr:DUF3857 domain-containing transglutaminase family protein [Bacteroidota bacterium]